MSPPRIEWAKDFGPPPDPVAAWALLAALVALVVGPFVFRVVLRTRLQAVVVAALALIAASLSAGYVVYYLRGGPRIIDATSYWLEARAFARGLVTWAVDEPTASVRGRFLLLSGPEGSRRIGVIFPPGYPAVLALGFLVGAPLAVGPLLAGALVLATYGLARELTGRRDVACLAAFASAFNATLRYHTADTMAHGWAALLVTVMLLCAHRAARDAGRDVPGGSCLTVLAAASGLSAGWLFATRPMTALALVPLLVASARKTPPRGVLAMALAASIPVALFALEQWAVTGAPLAAAQSAYYAVSDGPPGCFRVGFGKGIGCLHEHGDYVGAVLPHGFGARAAVVTTLRRLRLHILDVANAEPLALLVPARLVLGRCERGLRWIAAGVGLVILAYSAFYFDGSYPGGGARLYADVLPLEHVLLASGLVFAAERVAHWRPASRVDPRLSVELGATLASAVGLTGFALHGAFLHLELAERDGGRPYFEPEVLAKAKVSSGLLFTGTDHAFNLAFDPAAADPRRSLVVSREYGDDRDRLVWERLGRPPAYRYVFEVDQRGRAPEIVPWTAPPFSWPYRYEAEAEWPPLAQEGGFVAPTWATGTCAWGGRVLIAHPAPGRSMRALISFPVPYPGRFRVGVHVASRGRVQVRVALLPSLGAPPVASWFYADARGDFRCSTLQVEEAELSDHANLEIESAAGEFSIDAVELTAAGQ